LPTCVIHRLAAATVHDHHAHLSFLLFCVHAPAKARIADRKGRQSASPRITAAQTDSAADAGRRVNGARHPKESFYNSNHSTHTLIEVRKFTASNNIDQTSLISRQ